MLRKKVNKNKIKNSFYCKYPYREIIARCICAQHIEWQFKDEQIDLDSDYAIRYLHPVGGKLQIEYMM